MSNPKYPRKWQHKETQKILRVMPWWEIPYDEEIIQTELDKIDPDSKDDRRIKIGVLVQVGFLLENEHQVWLGVGPKAQEHFNDLGEWKKDEKVESGVVPESGESEGSGGVLP